MSTFLEFHVKVKVGEDGFGFAAAEGFDPRESALNAFRHEFARGYVPGFAASLRNWLNATAEARSARALGEAPEALFEVSVSPLEVNEELPPFCALCTARVGEAPRRSQ